MNQVRFVIKSVQLYPTINFKDDGYKIHGKLRDLFNSKQQFEIDDILEFLTFENLKESFFKSFYNPYIYLFKHITFDYGSHTDRKKKTILDVNKFNIEPYYFHFLSNYLEVVNEDDETIVVIFEGLNKSFSKSDLEFNKIKIQH